MRILRNMVPFTFWAVFHALMLTTTTFAANLQENRYEDRDAERYGFALALAANGQYQEGRQQIAQLLRDRPANQTYQLAQAQIEMAAGQFDSAVIGFAKAYQYSPQDRAAGLYYANALVKTQRYDDAKQVLKRALLQRPKEPTLHALLARAEGEAGNQLEAHQALVEHFYLRGNRHEALRQLALAKQYVGDSFYARASVEARTKEIERELSLAGEKLTPPKSEFQYKPAGR